MHRKLQEGIFLTEATKYKWIAHPKPYTEAQDLVTRGTLFLTDDEWL